MSRCLPLILFVVLAFAACNQRPNPPVDWPPMPDYGAAADAGADAR